VTVLVVRGDARRLPLPDGRVDLIVTSPPYFGLRSYTDGGAHYAGQIGSEATPAEWLEALWACTREWVRVLKPEGSLFVNLGDKYSDRGHGPNRGNGTGRGPQAIHLPQTRGPQEKSLLGLPWRYAIGCMDRLGLILRADIVWAKPNGLPESVTDRVRRAHEQVFHFTRQPRYYAAVDEIREPHQPQSVSRTKYEFTAMQDAQRYSAIGHANTGRKDQALHPLGKLPGSVWEIPSAPLQVPARLGVDHFAAFPPALVRPIVLGWSPPGVCTACGRGRHPVASVAKTWAPRPGLLTSLTKAHGQDGREGARSSSLATITGYACACGTWEGSCTNIAHAGISAGVAAGAILDLTTAAPPTRPAVVLDPFGGTGTTALVASAYGRTGVTVDLSADYCRLAQWRVGDPGERARARAMPKPPPVPDGQEALFTIAEGYSPIF
jgi:DNA modification methylase